MKIPLFTSVLLSGTILYSSPLYAVCTLAPDCADLGYTMSAADCEGRIAVKCPTDMSKLFCSKKSSEDSLPILYGDGTVSKNVISGKTPIGIVFDEANKLALALVNAKSIATKNELMPWSNIDCDVTGLTNCSCSNSTCSPDGQKNTKAILDTVNNGACRGTPAATACDYYEPEGCTKDFCKKQKWFLASTKEWLSINSVKSALNASLNSLGNGAKPLSNGNYWSSNEADNHNAHIYRLTSSSVSQSGKPNNNYYVRPVVYYGEPKESGDVCTNEKWYLYLNFVGQKNGNVCSVKQADSSIVVESSTGKRGTVTEVALSGNVNANAWSNWAEIILDPGAERIGYIGDGAYISSFSKGCSNLPLGVEFLTEDSGEYLHEYAYNKGSVKIAWEYDNDETIATCSGDVTLIITENYTE